MPAFTKRRLAPFGASLAVVVLTLLSVALGAASAHPSKHVAKPAIRSEKVGYFGNANVTYSLTVVVHTNVGPRAGNHVTVCLRGVCERATGHNGTSPWYDASFDTGALVMGDPVTFTVQATDRTGHAKTTVTTDLACFPGTSPQG